MSTAGFRSMLFGPDSHVFLSGVANGRFGRPRLGFTLLRSFSALSISLCFARSARNFIFRIRWDSITLCDDDDPV